MSKDLQKEIQRFTLADLALPVKTLFTGYLLAIGLGLMVAGGQIMLTHGMADGKFGLSVEDIIYSYHGDRSASTLEGKLNGSMKDMAPPDVRMDIIRWVRDGAPESEWDGHFNEIFATNCVPCHSTMPNIPNFTSLEEVKKVARVNEGASIPTLTRVSHIHLFGISFIFFFVGWIFTYATGFSPTAKAVLIFTPFAFLIVDILSWWLTKLDPNFAWVVIIGGFGYSVAATIMIFTSLYQMWVLPMRTLKSGKPPEA